MRRCCRPPYRDAAQKGCGDLTEIDTAATPQEALDDDTQDYVTPGACTPPLPLEAMKAGPLDRLVLPGNI